MNFSRMFLLAAFTLLAAAQIANAKAPLRVGQSYLLPTGDKVTIIGAVGSKKGERKDTAGLMLSVEGPNAKLEKLPDVSDAFFGHFWGPALDADGTKTRATIYLEVPGKKVVKKMPLGERSLALLRNLDYERKEKGLWHPVGRPMPDWLKVPAAKDIRLTDGTVIRLESAQTYQSHIAKAKIPALNIVGGWTSDGSRTALEQIRRFSAERLGAMRSKNDFILIYNLRSPKKEGFHFRPQIKAFVLRKSDDDFWLVNKFQLAQFTEGKTRVSLVWYVPTRPFEKMTPAELRDEARQLHEQIGAKVADDSKVKKSVIMANWPAVNAGGKVWRYGTEFERGRNGAWRMKDLKKSN